MVETKYWTDCSEEERKTINKLSRDFLKKKKLYRKKEINDFEYWVFLSETEKLLNFYEWYFNDETKDYLNWKKSFEWYQKYRENL